jgi:fumarate reductase subunit D
MEEMIDLSSEVRLWVAHRVSALILFVLIGVHFIGNFVRPARNADIAAVAAGTKASALFYLVLAAVAVFHAAVGTRQLRTLCNMLWPPNGKFHFMSFTVVAERWCGLALAGFLVIHFGVIATTLLDTPLLAHLFSALGHRVLSIAEALVLAILALHVVGGIRVMIHEKFETRRFDRPLAILAYVAALAAAAAWCLHAFG